MLGRIKIYIKFLLGMFHAESLPTILGHVVITGPEVSFGSGCRFINCSIVGPVSIGEYVSIADHSLIKGTATAKIIIGSGTIIGPYTVISADYHVRLNGHVNNTLIKEKYGSKLLNRKLENVRKPIIIGQDCWIGMSVYIRPGVIIGDRVTIGANSTILSNIPDDQIVAGLHR